MANNKKENTTFTPVAQKTTITTSVNFQVYKEFSNNCERRKIGETISKFMDQYNKHGENLFYILDSTPF